ncbi:MAG TPA: DNA adenine methylase [Pyrinomonadaceae bacterium]
MAVVEEQIKPTRPILRYHGGKWLLASWIISNFPPHRVYTEAFGGAASVLIQKPRTYGEIYNDLDGEVCNLFRVLRDPAQARELKRLIGLTPFARTEFETSYLPDGDPIEQARRTVIRSFMGFVSAAASGHKTGFRPKANNSGTTPARDWANYPDAIAILSERLRGVVIENKPAVSVMEQHDGPQTLHYVDPPYVLETRSPKKRTSPLYRFELKREDHCELAETLRSLKGMVVLSGYPCDLYDRGLYPDWQRIEREAVADGARARTEVLWFNDLAWERRASAQSTLSFEAFA